MNITANGIQTLLAVLDVLPANRITAACLGLAQAAWDVDKAFLSKEDRAEADKLRADLSSDFKVMLAKRGIPVKP